MANFAVTKYNTGIGAIVDVVAAMETYIETIADTKVIYLFSVVPMGSGSAIGFIVHTA